MTFPVVRTLRFASAGALALPANLLVAWFLHYEGIDYHLATFAGYIVHILILIPVSRKFIFPDSTASISGALVRAGVVEVISITILLGAVHYFIEYLKLSFIYARILAITFTGVWDYVGHSFVTFLINPLKK